MLTLVYKTVGDVRLRLNIWLPAHSGEGRRAVAVSTMGVGGLLAARHNSSRRRSAFPGRAFSAWPWSTELRARSWHPRMPSMR
jgi:hypothetical protein